MNAKNQKKDNDALKSQILTTPLALLWWPNFAKPSYYDVNTERYVEVTKGHPEWSRAKYATKLLIPQFNDGTETNSPFYMNWFGKPYTDAAGNKFANYGTYVMGLITGLENSVREKIPNVIIEPHNLFTQENKPGNPWSFGKVSSNADYPPGVCDRDRKIVNADDDTKVYSGAVASLSFILYIKPRTTTVFDSTTGVSRPSTVAKVTAKLSNVMLAGFGKPIVGDGFNVFDSMDDLQEYESYLEYQGTQDVLGVEQTPPAPPVSSMPPMWGQQ